MSIINIFITLTFFFFFFLLSFSQSISARPISTTATKNNELATQVCNLTTDPKICLNTFKADPGYYGSAPADPVSLAYIIFNRAYGFGNFTKANIESNITKIGSSRKPEILNSLLNCQSYYKNAIGAFSQVLENLDSETYCFFDDLSASAQNNATACGKCLRRNMPLARDNDYFINLAGICYAVAKLFSYNC